MKTEEGIIKFDFKHDFLSDKNIQEAKASDLDGLCTIRSFMIENNLIGVDPHGQGFGNLSMTAESNHAFFITGSQTGSLINSKPEIFTLVRDFDLDNFWLKSSGKYKPSSESLSHAAFYKYIKTARYVAHFHHEIIWKKLIEANQFFKECEYGTKAMVNEVKKIASKQSIKSWSMKGHQDGVICWGETKEEIQSILKELLKEIK